MSHVTIATSSGIVWLALIAHFGAALVALAAGSVALAVTKGGRLHKQTGIVFTWAMIASGLLAAAIAAYEGKGNSVVSGLFAAYLAFTAATAVKRMRYAGRGLHIALMILAFSLAGGTYAYGVIAWQSPHHMLTGVPVGMYVFMGTVCLLAALGDLRMIRAPAAARGTLRLTRHLWRMCFSLFIATGSFFLGQMKFVPAPIRVLPLLVLLGIAPLLMLLYWAWRVGLRRRVIGLLVAN